MAFAPHESLVQIETSSSLVKVRPSQFNSRSIAEDGTLLLYNSYSGAFSGFPAVSAQSVIALLRKSGQAVALNGLAKYLFDRGYLVKQEVNELDRSRILYAAHQHRPDELELILLTSEECNFRCVYCYETFPRGTMQPWVRRGVVELVKSRARRLNHLDIAYFGGEPLLGLEAIDEIAPTLQSLCKEQEIHFTSGMTTNGYLLTPEVSRRLIGWGINSFQITIDGPAEHHNAHRPLKGGGESFATVLANVTSMKHIADPFSVALRVNFDERNKDSMTNLLDALDPLRGDTRFALRFYPVGKWGGANDENLEVCGNHQHEVRHSLDLLAIERGFTPESKWGMIRPNNRNTVCYAARPNNFIVGADGKLMKCTIDLDTRDHNIVGHLQEDGKMQLDLDKMTKWIKPYFEEDVTCQKCFHLPLCHGSSCPLSRIEDGSRPCPTEKRSVGHTLRSLWDLRKAQGHSVTIN